MHPYFEGIEFAAFAHRGGALEAAENTMDAFAYAVELGYRYIETDVQLTADGVVVVFHDDELERLSGATGRVCDKTWAELQGLKVLGQGRIPRLEDVLTAWPEIRFNIDAKTDDVAAPLCRIAERDNLDRLCLASSSDRRVAFLRQELGTGLCTTAASWETAGFLMPALLGLPSRRTDAHCFQIPTSAYGLPAVSERTIQRSRDAGKPLHVWTIDEELEMERLISLGVQGIMTDRPALLREVLKKRGLWE